MKTRSLSVVLILGAAVVALSGGTAQADNVSIGVNTPSVSFGLNVGAPPPLVAVPGLPVYHAPAIPHNYFVHGGYYYLHHQGAWFYSPYYNGPWSSLVIHQVPRPILRVPVTYYKRVPPGHRKRGGPPEWAGYRHGHGKDTGHHKHKGKNR
jgi:hypothetical protein